MIRRLRSSVGAESCLTMRYFFQKSKSQREKSEMNSKLATFVSRIFEPMMVLTVLVVVGAFRSGLTGSALHQFLFFSLFGMTIPVGIFRFWIVKTGRVKDWDIHNRKERIKPLGTLVLFSLFLFSLYIKLGIHFW